MGTHEVAGHASSACERARHGFARLTLTRLLAVCRSPLPGPGATARPQAVARDLAGYGLVRVRDRRLDLGGARLVQPDATTCGATVLLALAALGDPHLVILLATGRTSSAVLTPAGPAAGPACGPATAPPAGPVAGAASALRGPSEPVSVSVSAELTRQEVVRVQGLVNRHALGPVPWPRSLGSPPWAVAAQARWPGATYRFRAVDDDAPAWPGTVAALRGWLELGVPVPLLVGGDLGGGLAHAVPRHYVLALPWVLVGEGDPGPGCVHVYDPSSGGVARLDLVSSRPAGTSVPGLGGWHRVVGAIWPTPEPRS